MNVECIGMDWRTWRTLAGDAPCASEGMVAGGRLIKALDSGLQRLVIAALDRPSASGSI